MENIFLAIMVCAFCSLSAHNQEVPDYIKQVDQILAEYDEDGLDYNPYDFISITPYEYNEGGVPVSYLFECSLDDTCIIRTVDE